MSLRTIHLFFLLFPFVHSCAKAAAARPQQEGYKKPPRRAALGENYPQLKLMVVANVCRFPPAQAHVRSTYSSK